MKTIYDKDTRHEIIERISLLSDANTAEWGKMNIFQMVKHCRLWEEMLFSKKKYKQEFIGWLAGKMVLKRLIKNENPLPRSLSTLSELIVKENTHLEGEKEKWIALIEKHETFSNPDFIHPFFGKMNKEQIGILSYKHNDHHLRQFGR